MQASIETGAVRRRAEARRLWCGLGRCSRCSCPSFKGTGNICEDCGHHYDEHNTSPFRAPSPVDAEGRRFGARH